MRRPSLRGGRLSHQSLVTSHQSLLVQVEIADGFAGGGVLGLLHGLFKFLRQDVFLVGFLEPGIRKLVFALAILFSKNFLSV